MGRGAASAAAQPAFHTCLRVQAMKSIFEDEAKSAADAQAELLRERELAAVSINAVRARSSVPTLSVRDGAGGQSWPAPPQADVTLIAEEMEMDKEAPARPARRPPRAPPLALSLRSSLPQLAERKLREHNGDVTATLTSLVRQ